MQSKLSLSPEQRHALEAVYAFLRSASIYLEAHAPVVRGADEQQVASLVELGALCQTLLLEQFPELREWVFGRGGAA